MIEMLFKKLLDDGGLLERGAPFVLLLIVLLLIVYILKDAAVPMVQWAEKKWFRGKDIEMRIARLETFKQQVEKNVPEIGDNLAARHRDLQVHEDPALVYWVNRLWDFRVSEDDENKKA